MEIEIQIKIQILIQIQASKNPTQIPKQNINNIAKKTLLLGFFAGIIRF